jgi:hypothetical protein
MNSMPSSMAPAPIDHLDVVAAGQAERGAAGVHRHVAAADHRHRVGHFRTRPGVDAAQELDPVDHPGVVLAGHVHAFAPPGTDGQQDSVVSFLQALQGDVPAERAVQVDLEPRAARGQAVQVFLDDPRRQAKGGDAPHHHTAQAVGHLVDVHLVARGAEVVRRHQAGRPAADDRDGLLPGDRDRRRVIVAPHLVHDEALEIADLQGAVAGGTAAGGFAGRIAHPPADRAEGVGGGNRLKSLGKLALPDVGDVGGRVGADGTGDLAGRRDEMRVAGVVLQLGGQQHFVGAVAGAFDRHLQPTLPKGSGSRRR